MKNNSQLQLLEIKLKVNLGIIFWELVLICKSAVCVTSFISFIPHVDHIVHTSKKE